MLKKLVLHGYKDLFSLIVIFAIGLAPFFWLRGGFVVVGHDSGLPISPTEHFQDRLQTWTNRYESGSDQSFALGGFFIHGLEALIDQTSLSLSHQQSLQFSVYIILTGIAMYVFTRGVLGKDSELVAINAAVFYQINHFVLQGWFIAERTKFSLYIALPLLLLILHFLFKTKKPAVLLGVMSAIIVFVFNGGAFLPLFAGTFLAMSVWILISFWFSNERMHALKRFGMYVFSGLVLSFLLHMYWLLPYAIYVSNNFAAEVSKSGGTEGVINWVKSISQNTSYWNLMKLQGIQEWYVNPEHPYAKPYFQNILLQCFAYLFPTVLLIGASKKHVKTTHKGFILILLCIALIGIFFMAGSHEPFGFVYIWMIQHIPGFIAFRTPYYKFAPAFYVAFAPLLGLVVSELLNIKILRRFPDLIKMTVPVIVLILYFSPFFTTNFFQYTHKLSTKVQIPSYVEEYAVYSNSPQFEYRRVLLLPGNSIENSVNHYQWGYWSLASLQSLVDRHAYITPSFGYSLDRKMVIDLYLSLRGHDDNWENIADHLRIDAILVQHDVVDQIYKGEIINSASFIDEVVSSDRVTVDKQFGEWTLYRFNNELQPVATSYVQVSDYTEQFGVIQFLSDLFPEKNILFSPVELDNSKITKTARAIFPRCQDCLLQRSQVYFANPNIIITPGSTLESLQSLLNIFRQQELEPYPVQTLQDLYILQTSFFRKGESGPRIPVWVKYDQNLNEYTEFIRSFLTSFDDSTLKNTELQGYYNNLALQYSILKDISNVVNNKEEADVFLSSLSKVKSILNEIEQTVILSKTKHTSVYLADIDEPGLYDVYVHTQTLNAITNPDSETYKVNIANTTLEASTKTLETWQKVGNVAITEGGERISVEDSVLNTEAFFEETFRRQANTEEGIPQSFGQEQPCSIIPIGELSSHRYSLTFEVKSLIGEIEPSFHIVHTDEDAPELPYWGIKQNISDGSWKKMQIPFAGLDKKEYLFKICDTSAKEDHQVMIRAVQLDRFVEPLVALVKTNPQEEASTVSSSGTIQFNSITNTHHELELSNVPKGLVRLPIQSSQFWQFSRSQDQVINQVDGAFVGIYTAAESQEPITINYRLQKFYKLGWILSISGILISVLTLFLFVMINHAKNLR